MSNVPKNKTNAAVLVRKGAPDYTALSSDPQPRPKADEAGAFLLHTDTGIEYVWSGTAWINSDQTSARLIEQLRVLHQDNIELKRILSAMLLGIEIIADRQNDPLIEDISEE